MKNQRLLILLSVALASTAFAQLPAFTRVAAPYQPLTGGTPVAISAPSDEGIVAVPLQFVFPFAGASFQTVYVHVNGQLLLSLPQGCSATFCSTFGQSTSGLPSTFATNQIAGFWDDLQLTSSGTIRVLSTPAALSVEWSNIEAYGFPGPFTLSFTITIEPNGNVSIDYGPRTGTSMSGSSGFQIGTAAASVLGATCQSGSPAGCCGITGGLGRLCSELDWVPNTRVTLEPPVAPDLVAQSVSVSNFQVVQPTNELSMTVTVRALNFSLSPVNSFTWRAVLSPDPLLDPPDGGPGLLDGGTRANDIPLTPESTGNALAARGQLDFTKTVSTTGAPPPGDYFVLVQLGSDGQVQESSEVNNVAVLPYSITNGIDLSATAITGVSTSGPDSQDLVRLQYFNRGAEGAGPVNYRIMLSQVRDAGLVLFPDGGPVDPLLPDGGDGLGPVGMTVVHRETRVVTGGESIDESVLVTMPPDAPNGDFFYVLQLDPGRRVGETNERNNVVFSSGQVAIRRADLVLEAIEIVDPATRVPVRNVLFGDSYRAIVRFRNAGGGVARNYRIGVILSADSTLSLLSDTIVAEQSVAQTVASPSSTTLEIPFSLPVVDRADAGYATGNYYLFVALDSRGAVFESNKGNNSGNIGPLRALSPAPDYSVASLQAPASAGVGEVIPVFRTIRNIGNRPAARVPYRYYASANSIVTTSDVPLELQLGDGGTALAGSVQLGSGVGDSATELVKLPGAMPPGSYFIGCLVDPDDAVVELSEANNALASNPVQVVQSSLRLLDSQLPDATVGRAYFYRLSAAGESSQATTWRVDAAQGALPAGLSLSSAGELSGTLSGADGAGVRAFTVVAENGGRQATARLVLRVLPPTAAVAITTASVPAIVNSASAVVQYPLGAAGGSRPYTWRIASGALPPGLSFNADGIIGGAPRAGTPDGVSRVTFEVRDASGGSDRRELQLRLVAAGSIVLRTTSLPDGLTGRDYTQDIAVQNADNSALARPLKWVVSGAVPPGLVSTEESEVLTLSGRPTRAGTYTFTISVEDARGRRDSLDYTITVYTNRFRLLVTNLPQIVRPGDPLSATFSTTPTGAVRWSIVSGALPAGLTLSPEGTLSGAVEDLEANLGTFSFVVEARDAAGASGLAPYGLVVERAPRRMNCSAVDAGPIGALLALLALCFRRGRRRALPYVAAAAVVAPVVSLAQPYQVAGPTPAPFQALPSTRTVVTAPATISLPFTFRFGGVDYTSVSLTRLGYVALGNSGTFDSSNEPIPHNVSNSFTPGIFLAPWWDNLTTASASTGNFAWLASGTAPNRIVALEWRDMVVSTSNTQRFTMQVLLYESSNQVRFSYGSVQPQGTSSASVGIQWSLGSGVAGLTCGAPGTCGASDWPSNQAIDFFQPPDLRVPRVSVDQTGYAGVRYGATAFVRNAGGRVATNVTVRFFLSADATLDLATDTVIGDATAPSLPVGAETPVVFPGSLPSSVAAGSYFVLALVDPANAVSELDETNNASPPVSMSVGMPKADLSVSNVTATSSSSPGAMVMVTRTIANVGNAPVGEFKFTWLLSDNNVISISDRALTPVQTLPGLAAAGSDMGGVMLALPADLTGGSYWLGVCVNFDGAAATAGFQQDEITVTNNCAASPTATVVSTGALTILTSTLPAATQYAPYGLRLRATGGSGSVAWSLTAGAL
ncbi:MAG: putative Ig domain-containing protein, partial [Myxococcaceae bacterium]|nr:putative Ig domain-containing protein [Myxococcaceae bacterium]